MAKELTCFQEEYAAKYPKKDKVFGKHWILLSDLGSLPSAWENPVPNSN